MRNVLGVLEDTADRLWSTFDAAVSLADEQRARLTLVKTRETQHPFLWCGYLGFGGIYVPPEEDDPDVTAGRLLARAAEFVPVQIPVTTMVLGVDTQRELRRLVESGAYDAVVATERLLRRGRRLRRECQRDCVHTVGVHATPHREPERRPMVGALSVTR